MSWPDIINSGFEFFTAPFAVLSILKLVKEKKVRGVSFIHMSFITLWGFWNLYFYPYLGQWWSFIGGIAIVLTNLVWVTLIFYYMRKEKHDHSD